MKNAKALLELGACGVGRAFLAGAWEVWAASCRATIRALLVSIWLAFERAASTGSVGVPPPAAGSVCLLGKR